MAVRVLWTIRPALAAAFVVLSGMLFLPEFVVAIEKLPPLDKRNLPYLMILLAVGFRSYGRAGRLMPASGWDVAIWTLVLMELATGPLTSQFNRDPIPWAGTMTSWDGVSIASRDLLYRIFPFLSGWVVYSRSRDLRDLLMVLVAFALGYAVLALWEVRMSPQLHHTVYGYYPQSFLQAKRGGGFRPIVFMNHGLALALFMCIATLAAALLGRAKVRLFRTPSAIWSVTLLAVLALCKSLAALVYAVLLAPVVFLLSPRRICLVAVVLASLTLAYPTLRARGWFPIGTLTEVAGWFGEERAGSLAFRFENEDLLLVKARERPVLGWGSKGRPMVINERSGHQESVVDGHWVLLLGYKGRLGWTTVFGLLLLPVFRTWRVLPRVARKSDRYLMAGLALLVSVYGVDLLPNGFFSNLPLFLAGALHGLARSLPGARRGAPGSPPDRRSAPDPEAPSVAPPLSTMR